MKTKLLTLGLFFAAALSAHAQVSVKPVFAKPAATEQSGYPIRNSLDGNANTIYSAEYIVRPNALPDVLDYYFAGVGDINKLEYLPRQDGNSNGIWNKIDIYYTTQSSPSNFVLLRSDVVLANNNTLKSVDLSATPIIKPKIVRLVVKAATNNYSTCADLNFYSSTAVSTTPVSDCTPPTSEFAAFADAYVDRSTMTAVASRPGHDASYDISKSLDGNVSTFYHNRFNSNVIPVTAANPALLTYTLPQTSNFNTIKYTPRPGGGNGDFGEIEIAYKQTATSNAVTLLNYDCRKSNLPSLIDLPQTLVNAYQIIITVKSGEGDYVNCAEMEFLYGSWNGVNHYPNIFNALHSELQPNVGQADIDAISSPFYKTLAQCLQNNSYNKRFRVLTALPYKKLGTITNKLKTAGITVNENPTGIVFEANTQAVIFVEPTASEIILHTANYAGEDNLLRTYYPLKSGFNYIQITNNGIGYIDYFTDDEGAAPVNVNITTGVVNGYYNPTTDTDEDWQAMLTNNAYNKIDIKGTYINSNLDKGLLLKSSSYPSGKRLAEALDKIVKTEYEMMGLFKYNIVPKNHMFVYTPIGGGLYSAGIAAHMGLNANSTLNFEEIVGGSLWGYSHELGHINQVRPAFLWHGMTEVTNNIYSAYCQYLFGTQFNKSSRYENEEVRGAPTTYYPAIAGSQFNAKIQMGKIQHKSLYEIITDNDRGACRVATIPFWQLVIYYTEAGASRGTPSFQERLNGTPAVAGQTDYANWLPDFMETSRNSNTNGVNDIQLMLNAFVNMCDAVKEDLSSFFLTSGYLNVVDNVVDDYGNKRMTLTQAQIDETVARIKAKGYPAPASPNIEYISLNSLNIYKNRLPLSGEVNVGVTLNPNADPAKVTVTVSAAQWQNAVAFETYNQNTLIDVAIFGTGNSSLTTTIVRYPQNATAIYAVGYDGARKLVYPSTAQDQLTTLPVSLISFSAKKTTSGALLSWKTANENNNAKFEIYKKTGEGNFMRIGEKNGNGTKAMANNYQFVDNNFNKDAYYFLKQIDSDGKATAYDDSKWIRFLAGGDLANTLIFPNPATTSFTVRAKFTNYQLQLVNAVGTVVLATKANGNESVYVDISNLPSGIYLVKVISEQGTQIEKLIKK